MRSTSRSMPAGCVTLFTLLAVLPAVARAQGWPPAPAPPPPALARRVRATPDTGRLRAARLQLLHLLAARAQLHATGAIVSESEPNDSPPDADVVAFGDTVSGAINPAGDLDFFAVDLTAGTLLDLDVDAAANGSALDPIIALFGPDGNIPLAIDDNAEGPDSRILYEVPATGRYYAAITASGGSLGGGGPSYTYSYAIRAAMVDETEPNDTPGQANVVAPDDAVVGLSNSDTDVDVFAITLPGASRLDVSLSLTGFYPVLRVYDVDGATLLDSVSSTVSVPRLQTYIPTAGTYYVALSRATPQGGTMSPYLIAFNSGPTGPGDPATLVASGIPAMNRIAAGPSGEVYVNTFDATIDRVDPDGAVTTIGPSFGPFAIVVDGLGRVLTTGYNPQTGAAGIWEVRPDSALLFASFDGLNTMTLAPNGDIWVTACSVNCPSLLHLDPGGTLVDSIPVTTGVFPLFLAVSPGGVLHFTDGTSRVYALSGTTPQLVITAEQPLIQGIAFDEDGYLYVVSLLDGSVALYDPAYQLVDDRFATTNMFQPIDLAFLRAPDGTMTSRIVVADPGTGDGGAPGRLVELNPDGIRAPGLRIGVDLLSISNPALRNGMVGAPYVDTLQVSNATGPVVWRVSAGALPEGIALDSVTGILSGVPADSGTSRFSLRVEGGGRLGVKSLSITVTEPVVSVTIVVDALLGVDDALTPEQQMFLDVRGNHNGHLDVGDLRAYLRRQGQLPAAARARAGSNEP